MGQRLHSAEHWAEPQGYKDGELGPAFKDFRDQQERAVSKRTVR